MPGSSRYPSIQRVRAMRGMPKALGHNKGALIIRIEVGVYYVVAATGTLRNSRNSVGNYLGLINAILLDSSASTAVKRPNALWLGSLRHIHFRIRYHLLQKPKNLKVLV